MPEPALEPAREQIKAAEPAYLTAPQVAELLQVDEKTVLCWSLEDASMPVLRRGRVVRFPRERLLACSSVRSRVRRGEQRRVSTNRPPRSATS